MIKFVIFLVKCYQKTLSPRTGVFNFIYLSPIFNLNPSRSAGCRQEPRCSQYCIEVVAEQGVLKGLAETFKRVVNCL